MPETHVALAPHAQPAPNPAGANAMIMSNNTRGSALEASAVECDLPMAASPPLSAAHDPVAPLEDVSITLRVHGELAEIEPAWRQFEQRADCTVFQSFDWLAKLQRHIGKPKGTIPAIVTGRDPNGELLFILQLAIETHGPFRRLTWLGSELCDYNTPLLGPNFSHRVGAERFVMLWREVLDLLRAEPRFRFDWIDLQKMPEMIGSQKNPFAALDPAIHPSGAYVATLGRTWEQYYATMRSSATRKKERGQLKKLAEHGEVRFINVEDRADIARTVETLIRQKSRSFARMGVEDLFARPGYDAFYRDITTDPNVRAVIHVTRLDVGTTSAATGLGLQFRDSYSLVLSSYEDGALTRFGPGRAHLQELLRHAIGRGYRYFDFSVGDEPSKRDWSDIELKLYDYLAAQTVRGHCVLAAIMAFRRIKRFIKQTPALWHAFSKARALLASLRRR